MPLQKNKKIIVYFFLFILIGSINNKNIQNFKIKNIDQILVSGLSDKKNIELKKNLDFLRFDNLFFLRKERMVEIIDSNNLVENYLVQKIYPSTLEIIIDKTNFLANFNKEGNYFLIGSNGKSIIAKEKNNDLPFIFGNFEIENFLKFKKMIDSSSIKFNEIENIYYFPSGRWDIEMYSDILIKLPKDKVEEKLNLINDILIDDQFKDIKIIDLRQKNQIVING